MERTRFSFKRKGSGKSKAEKEIPYDFDAMTYLSQEIAQQISDELMHEFTFSEDQLVELSGLSCAAAIVKMYQKESFTKNNGAILVCCGPGNNGATGLACARHLKLFGYRPTVFYPKPDNKSLHHNLTSQCEKMDIPFLCYFPGETQLITDSYNLIIDAFFGLRFKGPVRGDFGTYMSQMTKSGVPICSIDIPSGWDVDEGTPEGIQPESLISIMVPKNCAKSFKGKTHYLGGRFVPPDLAKKYKLNLPPYPGTDQCVELLTQTQQQAADDKDKDPTENEK